MGDSLTDGEKADLFDQLRRTTPTDCIWIFSADWTELVFLDGNYEELFGRPPDALNEDPTDFLEAVRPEDRAELEAKMKTVADGDPVEAEYRVDPEAGTELWVRSHAEPVRNDDGEVTRIAGFTRNITEGKRRKRELERQNERLERFAQVVSHDLRNPLTVAEGHLELARQDCESEHLETVQAELDRTESLIEDLLTLARRGQSTETVEPVNIEALAVDSWSHVETGGATLTVETDRTVLADPARLRQLLENCFRNSVEHGTSGSRPGANDGADCCKEAVAVTVGDFASGFYVADDGSGFPEQQADRVFESGYSTRASNTGLGLAIVEEVATAHGWTVRATESEAGGARIEFRDVDFEG